MTVWPKDTQSARNAFYGDPGKGQIGSQMVPVVPPFAMYYEGRKIKAIQFHQKAAPALLAVLNEIWDYCQHDQAKVDASGASNYNGAYNHRLVRGSSTKWSNHAYAAAIDLNAGENALGVKKGTMPQFIVDAFCRQGAMWGGWYTTRPDWMHFEFVDNGGRKPKSPAPVFGTTSPVSLIDRTRAPADEFDDESRDDPEIIRSPSDEKQPVGDGFVGTSIKIIKSKTAWASSALGGVSLASVGGFLTDWRTIAVIGTVGLVAYIIYERSRKP